MFTKIDYGLEKSFVFLLLLFLVINLYNYQLYYEEDTIIQGNEVDSLLVSNELKAICN